MAILARACIERIAAEQAQPVEALAHLRDVYMSARDVLPDGQAMDDDLDVHALVGLYYSYDEPTENDYEPEKRLVIDETERLALLDSHAREEAHEWLQRHPTDGLPPNS